MRRLFIHFLTCSLMAGFFLPQDSGAGSRQRTGHTHSQRHRAHHHARHADKHRRADSQRKDRRRREESERAANARVIDATGKYRDAGHHRLPLPLDARRHQRRQLCQSPRWCARATCSIRTTSIFIASLAGGVTTLNLLHGSANAIGGLNTVVKIKYGRPVEEFFFPGAMPGIKFALGENPKALELSNPQPGQPRRYPATRMGVEEVIRDAFTRARDYKKTWDEYRAAVATRRQEPDSAAARSSTRAVGRGSGRQTLRSCALLPRGRDPDADQYRR